MSRYILIQLCRDDLDGHTATLLDLSAEDKLQNVTVMDVPDDMLEDVLVTAGLINEGCSDSNLTVDETVSLVMEVLED